MHRPVLSSQFAHVPWLGAHPAAVWRRPAARALHALAVHMRRLARRLVVAAPARAAGLVSLPELEFHAEAGAPEGALYVNGEYVGRLDVHRL